jgi:hypothetical protein
MVLIVFMFDVSKLYYIKYSSTKLDCLKSSPISVHQKSPRRDSITHKFASQISRDPASFATIRFAHIVASVRLSNLVSSSENKKSTENLWIFCFCGDGEIRTREAL